VDGASCARLARDADADEDGKADGHARGDGSGRAYRAWADRHPTGANYRHLGWHGAADVYVAARIHYRDTCAASDKRGQGNSC
jgi:hypothetical protein